MDVIKTYLSNDGLSKLGEMIMPMITSAFSGIGGAILGAIFDGGGDDKKALLIKAAKVAKKKPRHVQWYW